ncbi:Ribosome biogenesis protein BRX1-like protein isoform X2 [Oopsacas minuta]|uniref:Ribosome biogenesis protein BRX1 homolog n=1 Tax=Oopsacas minuta TaxID=111878 RepID=A0AAV7JK77_9METZ|nr:Ribosome biogenesis protein BRX1-like protein isoform X2 [Oopsacas minuta]
MHGKRKNKNKPSREPKRPKLAKERPQPKQDTPAEQLPAKITSEQLKVRKNSILKRWTNRTRTLVFSSRSNTFRIRYLMRDLLSILPHAKTEVKLEKKDNLSVINEICELRNCNNCIFFEVRKHTDMYVWFSRVPAGPSFKFLVENLHTTDELKLSGNCLKSSRHILCFDDIFKQTPYLSLIQELFTQTFSVPNFHPKSKPFIDHVLNFSFTDNRIWIRNYQIIDGGTSLLEIGPRFVLNLVRAFEGSFSGSVIYHNPDYISPNLYRSKLKAKKAIEHQMRVEGNQGKKKQKVAPEVDDPLDIF